MIEANIGAWEGLNWIEIGKRWPDPCQAFHQDPSINGYLGGENFVEVRDRCITPIREVVEKHAGKRIAVVAHNVVNRTLLAHWMGIPLRFSRKIPQSNCGYNVIGFRGNDAKVLSINQTTHLDGLLPAD
jgi:probable phosphoglycerate mutase